MDAVLSYFSFIHFYKNNDATATNNGQIRIAIIFQCEFERNQSVSINFLCEVIKFSGSCKNLIHMVL